MKMRALRINNRSRPKRPESFPSSSKRIERLTFLSTFNLKIKLYRSLVGSKTITQENMAPILDKMRDHLISKNVAAEVAVKLCESVAANLEGMVNK